MARIVVALGGNALGDTPTEQKKKVAYAAKTLANFIKQGNEIVVTHGNGPQVGMINLGLVHSAAEGVIKAEMPFPECGAMSQGYIGFHLQNALLKELKAQEINKEVLTVITQVEVDKDDPAFKNPTKPIGTFYSEEEAKTKMQKNPSDCFTEDSGRGWRKIVASPMPVDIVEKESIRSLVDGGFVVIACGGGGIPVVKKSKGDYEGIAAVIDKDYASECLAEIVDADYLYILTAVDSVCINYGKSNEQPIKEMTCKEAMQYAAQGQFAIGSMLPKVNAAVKYASSKVGRKAVICSLGKAELAMEGVSGTVVY